MQYRALKMPSKEERQEFIEGWFKNRQNPDYKFSIYNDCLKNGNIIRTISIPNICDLPNCTSCKMVQMFLNIQ